MKNSSKLYNHFFKSYLVEKRLVKAVKVLPASIKLTNPMQK